MQSEIKLKPHPYDWPVYIQVGTVSSKEGTSEDRIADWLSFFIVAVPPEGGCHCHWINFACPPYGGPAITEAHKGPHWDHVNHVGSGGHLIPWNPKVWEQLCRLQDEADKLGKRLLHCLKQPGVYTPQAVAETVAEVLSTAWPVHMYQCPNCGEMEDYEDGYCHSCGEGDHDG